MPLLRLERSALDYVRVARSFFAISSSARGPSPRPPKQRDDDPFGWTGDPQLASAGPLPRGMIRGSGPHDHPVARYWTSRNPERDRLLVLMAFRHALRVSELVDVRV